MSSGIFSPKVHPRQITECQQTKPQASQQRRICVYLSLKCRHSLTFLHLPPAIRRQIYDEAGIVVWTRLCLNTCSRHSADDQYVDDFRPLMSMLLTCRTINAEISQIFYSENIFLVHQDKTGGLESLRKLRPSTLSHIKSLRIYIDINSDGSTALCCFSPWRRWKCHQHGTDPRTCSARTKLRDIHDALDYVLRHTRPFLLRLRIVCQVKDVHMADEILSPLRTTTTLLDCAIHLNTEPNTTLAELARDIATQAMGRLQRKGIFRFFELPLELRLKILEETDLFTNSKAVSWSPVAGYYECNPCNYLSPSKEVDDFSELELMRRRKFCQHSHAAYSQYCQCWVYPTSLFLVCKALRDEARRVFFRSNRIIVHPSGGRNSAIKETPQILEISHFLRKTVPVESLSSIRFLEIVFPPFEDVFLSQTEPAYADWVKLMDFMKDHLDLHMLTLRIHFADYDVDNAYEWPSFRRSMNRAKGLSVASTYHRTIRPMSLLGEHGLRRFFLHLACPWRWTLSNRVKADCEIERFMMPFERKLESIVMGQDYDAASMGKDELGPSTWLMDSLNIGDYC